jgi:hypothetical protein
LANGQGSITAPAFASMHRRFAQRDDVCLHPISFGVAGTAQKMAFLTGQIYYTTSIMAADRAQKYDCRRRYTFRRKQFLYDLSKQISIKLGEFDAKMFNKKKIIISSISNNHSFYFSSYVFHFEEMEKVEDIHNNNNGDDDVWNWFLP